jgi:hypothetical protein
LLGAAAAAAALLAHCNLLLLLFLLLLLLLLHTQWAGVLIMPVGIAGIIASRLRQRLLDKELARIAAAPVGAKLHKILPLQVRRVVQANASSGVCPCWCHVKAPTVDNR